MKAMGTGFGSDVPLSDVTNCPDPGCPSSVQLRAGAARLAEEFGIAEWRLSNSHTDSIALASAIGIGYTHHDREEKPDAFTPDDPM